MKGRDRPKAASYAETASFRVESGDVRSHTTWPSTMSRHPRGMLLHHSMVAAGSLFMAEYHEYPYRVVRDREEEELFRRKI